MRAYGRRLRRATASVRVRVAAVTAATFAVVLVVASVLLLHALETHLTDRVRQQAEAAVQTEAQQVAIGGASVITHVDGGEPGKTISFQSATRDGVTIVAFPTGPGATGPVGGEASGSTDAAPGVGAGTQDAVKTYSVAGSGDVTVPIDTVTASRLGLGSGGPYIVATLPLTSGVSLAAVTSLAEVRATIDSTRMLMWWVVPGLVLLVAGLAWLVVGRALRPVHAVTAQLASIGGESLHERVPVPASDDEVNELATTMNSMLDRLESATATNRQLVSDASHELRTPIAVMRTELEVAQRDPATDWQTVSGGLLDEVDRLQGLVDDLLLLARTGERGLSPTAVDVVDVVGEVAARRRRVPVTVAVDGPPVSVDADRAALHRALDHLVTNAARHAATAVAITVDASVIHVDDDGAGIPADQREHVVERFVRLDEARARDAGGSGLGLAVAADVARSQGGALTIGDGPLGGARVTLALRPS